MRTVDVRGEMGASCPNCILAASVLDTIAEVPRLKGRPVLKTRGTRPRRPAHPADDPGIVQPVYSRVNRAFVG